MSAKSLAHDSHVTASDRVTQIREYTLYHYLTPRKMLAVHWRALHEKLDRLQADGNATAIQR